MKCTPILILSLLSASALARSRPLKHKLSRRLSCACTDGECLALDDFLDKNKLLQFKTDCIFSASNENDVPFNSDAECQIGDQGPNTCVVQGNGVVLKDVCVFDFGGDCA